MKVKLLAHTNYYLKICNDVRKQIIRSVASSTAVEADKSIQRIEARLRQKSSSIQVKLT